MPWTYDHLKPKVKPDLLSDEVPWRAMIAPGVVQQKQGYALQRSYLVRGPDLLNESDEVQGAAMLQANEVFKRLGGEWMLQSEAQRTRVWELPPIPWNDPIPALLDAKRREDMLVERESRETVYCLTLTWAPPQPMIRRGLRYFLQGPGHPARTSAEEDTTTTARLFIHHADFFVDLLKGMLAIGMPLTSAQTATYLHNCVSDRWYELRDLDDWNNLDHQLCDTALDPAGWYPQLGRWHLRTMSVQGYPAESMVGIMRKLDALNLDYRWSTRWQGMEKFAQQQFLKKAEARWVNQEKSVFDRSMENMTGKDTRVVDPDATNKALDVNAARQEIGMDLTAYGLFTSTVTVWDEDPIHVDTKLTAVMQAFAHAGFTVRAEDEHLVAAWLSSHPGNRIDNVRRTPQSALTLAHLAPGLNATWPGPERDEYFDDGPWFYAQTDGTNLFRVVAHLRDLAHFLVLGSTRCHSPGTEILMYDGSVKKVEEIGVGDQVMGPDSLPRNIVEIFHGHAEMAEVKPNKGAPFTVTMDHVLSLKRTTSGKRRRNDDGQVDNISVREWLKKPPYYKEKYKLYRTGVEFPNQEVPLPLPPYFLGVLLGDGGLTQECIRVRNPDPEIPAYLDELVKPLGLSVSMGKPDAASGCEIFSVVRSDNMRGPLSANPVKAALKTLGLWGHTSHTKFIPFQYKTASKEARLALVAGLLDTDGTYVPATKLYTIALSSQSLADDLAFVVRSLGLACYVRPFTAKAQNGYEGPAYRLTISGHLDIIPCQILRKQALPRVSKHDVLVTGIKRIEPIGQSEYYGFTCDGDHLYVMADFTVTHNSGKSTLANFMRAMWMQYAGAQAQVFDVDGHARLLTYLLGGYWYDLGSPTLRLQPLRTVDDPRRYGMLLNWLVDLCEEAGQSNLLLAQQYLAGGLQKLAKRPVQERTFSGLLRVFAEPPPGQQSAFNRNRIKVDGSGVAHMDSTLNELDRVQQEVRWVLRRFADGGEYHGIFDGTTDPLTAHPVQTFELRDLVTQERLLGPVIRYVMQEVREQMTTTKPMFLLLDDAAIAWLARKDQHQRRQTAVAPGRQTMEEQADDWLQTTAKKGVALGISTHSVEKILESRLGQIIIESCKHRYYLPNRGAMEKHIHAVYQEMGLPDNAIQTIATLRPQRDVLYAHEELGRVAFSLPFGRFELDCLARNSADDHALMDTLLAQEGREGFTAAYLRHRGWKEETDVVQNWKKPSSEQDMAGSTRCLGVNQDAAPLAGSLR